MSVPRTAWVITEGQAGHEQPCIGIAESLGIKPKIIRIKPSRFQKWLAPHLPADPAPILSSFQHPEAKSHTLQTIPYPDLALACGRQAIPYARALRAWSNGKTFVTTLHKTGLSPRRFDFGWLNTHDVKSTLTENQIHTTCTPNRITPEKLAAAPKFPHTKPLLTILIGGKSKTHTFDAAAMTTFANAIKEIAISDLYSIAITTSRRTGEENEAILHQALHDTNAYIWDNEGENPYLSLLASADKLIITSESVNMIGEAAMTRKPVFIWPLEGQSQKIERFHTTMMEEEIIRFLPTDNVKTVLEKLQENWHYTLENPTLRVRDEILARWPAHASQTRTSK